MCKYIHDIHFRDFRMRQIMENPSIQTRHAPISSFISGGQHYVFSKECYVDNNNNDQVIESLQSNDFLKNCRLQTEGDMPTVSQDVVNQLRDFVDHLETIRKIHMSEKASQVPSGKPKGGVNSPVSLTTQSEEDIPQKKKPVKKGPKATSKKAKSSPEVPSGEPKGGKDSPITVTTQSEEDSIQKKPPVKEGRKTKSKKAKTLPTNKDQTPPSMTTRSSKTGKSYSEKDMNIEPTTLTYADDEASLVSVMAGTSGEIILGKRISRPPKREVIDDFTQKPFVAKKVPRVKDDDQWWCGRDKPIMPEVGQSATIYARIFNHGGNDTSIESFVEGKLREKARGKPADYQVNHDAAQLWVNRCLGRPATKNELDKKCKSFNNKETASAVRQWVQGSETYLQQEIDLALLTNEIRLKYIPIKSSRESTFAGMERGRYEALVKINDTSSRNCGRTFVYKPTNDWVEDNFTEESLEIVQYVSKEIAKVYDDNISGTREDGFIPMNTEFKYEKDGAELQISKMRWIPPRDAIDSTGKLVKLSETWNGLIQTNNSHSGEVVELDRQWVLDNIAKPMRQFIRDVRMKEGNTGFVFIPEGDNQGNRQRTIPISESAPIVKYYDCDKQGTSRGCLYESTASGLSYLGFQRLAMLLMSTRNDPNKMINPMESVKSILTLQANHQERKKFEYVALNAKKVKKWDPILSPKTFLLCALGIRSSDGKTDHAICIAGGWIFDSNFEKALPLSIESLNLCSSSSDRESVFEGVTRGHLLRER